MIQAVGFINLVFILAVLLHLGVFRTFEHRTITFVRVCGGLRDLLVLSSHAFSWFKCSYRL